MLVPSVLWREWNQPLAGSLLRRSLLMCLVKMQQLVFVLPLWTGVQRK